MPEILITDLTEMSPGSYCVAGWDWQRQRMVRLLMKHGGNWTAAHVSQTGLWHRRLVRYQPAAVPHGGAFPHATEDMRVDETTMQTFPRPNDWRQKFLQSESADVDSIFAGCLNPTPAGHLRKSPFVLPNSECASLGAVRANAADFQYYEDHYTPNKPKLRCRFRQSGSDFDLSVSSYRLRLRWREIGVREMNKKQGQFGQVHVRLGLARTWGDMNKCYLMLNGLYRAQDN